jgi:multidrug efflux pump subunit AcrA (membrane-fusion protein)
MKAVSASRSQATNGRSFSMIQSPLTGVVAERLTELGDMATPGKPLLAIYDPKGMRVVASIPQYKLAELRGNVRAKVEFPDTGQWVDATEVELLPVSDARPHVVRARVQLPDNLPGVVPAMFARAHFIVGQARRKVIPQRAIVRRGELTAACALDDKVCRNCAKCAPEKRLPTD